jgi:hypothetical protein
MSLLRSICCLFAGQCAGEEPKPTTETMRCEASPGILVKGRLSEKEPAKTNFDAWRAAQPALLCKASTKPRTLAQRVASTSLPLRPKLPRPSRTE